MAYNRHNKKTGTFQVKWDDLFGIIKKSAQDIVREHTYALKNDIKRVWPVKSGRSRDGWRVAGHSRGWTIYNTVKNPHTGYDYVPGLWNGASAQLPMGGDPIVRFRHLLLKADLRRLQLKKGGGRASLKRGHGLPSVRL